MTEGCLAVNTIGNHGITCELTTGLSNKDEMEDDPLAEIYVLGKLKTKISSSDSFTQVARPHVNRPLHVNYRVR